MLIAVGYVIDDADRLTQITQGSSNVSFSYDIADRRTSMTLPNGVSLAYSFDNDSRITGIAYNFGGNTLGNLTYSYDQLGRRTQVGGSFARTSLPGAVNSATYDAGNQLTQIYASGNPYFPHWHKITGLSHTAAAITGRIRRRLMNIPLYMTLTISQNFYALFQFRSLDSTFSRRFCRGGVCETVW